MVTTGLIDKGSPRLAGRAQGYEPELARRRWSGEGGKKGARSRRRSGRGARDREVGGDDAVGRGMWWALRGGRRRRGREWDAVGVERRRRRRWRRRRRKSGVTGVAAAAPRLVFGRRGGALYDLLGCVSPCRGIASVIWNWVIPLTVGWTGGWPGLLLPFKTVGAALQVWLWLPLLGDWDLGLPAGYASAPQISLVLHSSIGYHQEQHSNGVGLTNEVVFIK